MNCNNNFILDFLHWSYNLKFKFISPAVFHFFNYDNQNILEYNSYVNVNDYLLDKATTVKIYSSEGRLTYSHEFRWFMNHEKSGQFLFSFLSLKIVSIYHWLIWVICFNIFIALKIILGEREIRGLWHYSLTSIKGGYKWIYSGALWLDYRKDANSKSSISVESHYSLDGGVSAFNEINLLVPSFNEKVKKNKIYI